MCDAARSVSLFFFCSALAACSSSLVFIFHLLFFSLSLSISISLTHFLSIAVLTHSCAVFLTSSEQFRTPSSSSQLAFFSPGEQRPRAYEAVRANHHVYGAVAGDGVRMEIVERSNPAPGATAIENLTLCWLIKSDLSRQVCVFESFGSE